MLYFSTSTSHAAPASPAPSSMDSYCSATSGAVSCRKGGHGVEVDVVDLPLKYG